MRRGASSATTLTGNCAAVYLYARVVHVVVHIGGFGLFLAHTLAYTVGWIAFMTFAVHVFLQRDMKLVACASAVSSVVAGEVCRDETGLLK